MWTKWLTEDAKSTTKKTWLLVGVNVLASALNLVNAINLTDWLFAMGSVFSLYCAVVIFLDTSRFTFDNKGIKLLPLFMPINLIRGYREFKTNQPELFAKLQLAESLIPECKPTQFCEFNSIPVYIVMMRLEWLRMYKEAMDEEHIR